MIVGGKVVTANFANEHSSLKLIPGKTLCLDCRMKVLEQEFYTPSTDSGELFELSLQLSGTISEACLVLGLSPPKIKKYSIGQRECHRQKTQEILRVVNSKLQSLNSQQSYDFRHTKEIAS